MELYITKKEVIKINYLEKNNQFEIITNLETYNSDIVISTIAINRSVRNAQFNE